MEKWIDTHAHYGHARFKKNHNEVLKEMHKCVERIIQVGTNSKSNLQTLQLVGLYEYIYGMIGYFPTDTWEIESLTCPDANDNWIVLQKQLTNDKIVGIGEIGLDYNWNKTGTIYGQDARDIQKKWFRNQLDLAKEMKLPVSIHSRDAEPSTLKIFKDYDEIFGVIHCFSYGKDAAKAALDKGLCLGIGGTSTYPNNKELREVIKMCPLDMILLETDAPYLSPQPVRKEVNTSANIQYVIENISAIKGVSIEDVIAETNKNAYRVFPKLK